MLLGVAEAAAVAMPRLVRDGMRWPFPRALVNDGDAMPMVMMDSMLSPNKVHETLQKNVCPYCRKRNANGSRQYHGNAPC
jgi:hypothetical protein